MDDHEPSPDRDERQPLRPSASRDRFVYNPRNILERLSTGTVARSALKRSELVHIPYRKWVKYVLVFALVIICIVCSPQLLPHWVGVQPLFGPSLNLCHRLDDKVNLLKQNMEQVVELPHLRQKLEETRLELACFNKSAASYYHHPERSQWPDECTVEKANSQNLSTQVCVGPVEESSCSELRSLRQLLGGLATVCRSISLDKMCQTVFDGQRILQLSILERQFDKLARDAFQRANDSVVLNTANDKATHVISTLLNRVDLGSNLYIVYHVIALLAGTPLLLYKRGIGSRLLSVGFGMRKVVFVAVVVVLLTMYDACSIVLKQVDFRQLLHRFYQDPCYIDETFSQARIQLVMSTCSEINSISRQRDVLLQEMDHIYYLTRRFSMCEPSKAEYPEIHVMNETRHRFRDGDLAFYGHCKVSELARQEITPFSLIEKNGGIFSSLRLLLGSGLIAQFVFKVIASTWLIHLVNFIEPMVEHNGKVEIWDMDDSQHRANDDDSGDSTDENRENDTERQAASSASSGRRRRSSEGNHRTRHIRLNPREVKAAIAFARDRHLFPFLILTALFVAEIVFLVYNFRANNLPSPQGRTFSKLLQVDAAPTSAFAHTQPYKCLVQPLQ